MSLDGYIAGPKGEYDWITLDSKIDFGALFRQFDTLLMGRRTYQTILSRGQSPASMGMNAIVVSTTLEAAKHPGVTIISNSIREEVAALKERPGRDIWLYGGGVLFRSLLEAGLVDSVELQVIPVLLGDGIRLLPGGRRCPLRLKESKALPSGILALHYSVAR